MISGPRANRPTDLAVLLVAHPVAVARLLRDHVPDRHHRCRGCTAPGYGTPSGSWPCTLHHYALEAAHLIDATAKSLPCIDDE